MPRTPRSQSDIDMVKKEILDSALKFIIDNGFHNLSMRKLASQLGMTATTIYNYFSNKDEINLMIRMRGFEMLYRRLLKCTSQQRDPLRKLRAMIHVYFEFGISNPNYYDIMFNLNTPKYIDYVGTDLEEVAHTEREASLRTYSLTTTVIAELMNGHRVKDVERVRYKAIQLWCEVHGIISLHNSKLLREIDDNPARLINTLIEDVIGRFMKSGGLSKVKASAT